MICRPSFFGTEELPEIDLSDKILEELAERSAAIGLAVPGVQRKISLHLSSGGVSRLTLVDHPAGYILKPQSPDFRALPEAEDLAMDMANAAGIRTAEHGIIMVSGRPAYITKRMDRLFQAGGVCHKLAMEDFCQLSGRLTQDKYRGSYEKCAALISAHSALPGFDLSEFYMRLIISFISGNSDMHLKNFSLIETAPGSREYRLSDAYDLLPVNLVMPEDKEETALTLNGKKSRIKRDDFLQLAERAGISRRAAEKMIRSCVSRLPEYQKLCEESLLPDDMKRSMQELIKGRIERLS